MSNHGEIQILEYRPEARQTNEGHNACAIVPNLEGETTEGLGTDTRSCSLLVFIVGYWGLDYLYLTEDEDNGIRLHVDSSAAPLFSAYCKAMSAAPFSNDHGVQCVIDQYARSGVCCSFSWTAWSLERQQNHIMQALPSATPHGVISEAPY